MYALITLLTFFTALVSSAPMNKTCSLVAPSKSSNSISKSSGTFIAPSPRWVVYSDQSLSGGVVVPPSDQLAGFNVFILAFYLSSGPTDQVQAFIDLSESERKSIISDLHSNGISLMMSVFGSTDEPTTAGVDPTSFAAQVAGFVKQYGLDGVDVDYEDFDAINSGTGEAENWLVSFTNELRSHLPSGEYIITHAPVAPWFTTDTTQYPHGAYRTVAQKTGNAIDWFNIQYYNQDNDYSTCSHVITSSPSQWPNTAVKQIHSASGIPLSKLVVGKPADSADASSDFIDGSTLATCLQEAKSFGWNAGAMFWEWPQATASLISTVRGLSFPVLGS